MVLWWIGLHSISTHAHVQCVLEFPLACGITVGTPVRIRGVPVGSVLSVNPSLEKVEVLVEVRTGPLTSTLQSLAASEGGTLKVARKMAYGLLSLADGCQYGCSPCACPSRGSHTV